MILSYLTSDSPKNKLTQFPILYCLIAYVHILGHYLITMICGVLRNSYILCKDSKTFPHTSRRRTWPLMITMLSSAPPLGHPSPRANAVDSRILPHSIFSLSSSVRLLPEPRLMWLTCKISPSVTTCSPALEKSPTAWLCSSQASPTLLPS